MKWFERMIAAWLLLVVAFAAHVAVLIGCNTARAEVLIVSSTRAGCPCEVCDCGSTCLCPVSKSVLVPKAHEAVSHPDVLDQWLAAAKQQHNTTPEMTGAKSARTRATVSGESYSGVTEYVQCQNGQCFQRPARANQQAAKEPAGHWENYGLFGRKRRWVSDAPQAMRVQSQCANGRCK